jgi:serine/threonine protein phosphatase PrpC
VTETPTQPGEPVSVAPAAAPAEGEACAVCGAVNDPGASFCEECGADISAGAGHPASAPAQTAPAGEESPLDVGWTGPVVPQSGPAPADALCTACGIGHIVDGYCDHCGTPPPDPRNHVVVPAATWVGGVSDIGRRHSRNEDAIAVGAGEAPGSRAVLVVCDGVSMATDSHLASLAAAQAAKAVLDRPFPQGVGTPDAWAAGAARAFTEAVERANEAVAATVDDDVPNPPSCTFAAAVVENGAVVSGTLGDSRVYWLPDRDEEPARQLGTDDSFAQEQMAAGVPREEAENGPQAHSITRWLGRDSPDDLTPHLTTLPAGEGWLMVCSDGLWNYCSDAGELRELVRARARAGATTDPTELAGALVDFANEQGGRDNITVALARLAGRGSAPALPTAGATDVTTESAPGLDGGSDSTAPTTPVARTVTGTTDPAGAGTRDAPGPGVATDASAGPQSTAATTAATSGAAATAAREEDPTHG